MGHPLDTSMPVAGDSGRATSAPESAAVSRRGRRRALRRVFMQQDEDGSGTIELPEFTTLCRRLVPNLTRDQIERIFAEVPPPPRSQ